MVLDTLFPTKHGSLEQFTPKQLGYNERSRAALAGLRQSGIPQLE